MSKPTRAKRKEQDYYKLMQRTEKQVEARLKKEMNRFKDKDQFELEDHIIDLENKIKELNETIKMYEQHANINANMWAEPTLTGGPTTGYTTQQSSNTSWEFTEPAYRFTGATMPTPFPQETSGNTYQTYYGGVDPQPDVRTPAEPAVRIRR